MSNNPASSSSINWRNPSAAHMQKYGLQPLPEDFEPTEEEKALLQMYEIIRNTERVAARLKEEAARNKLNAKNEEFQKLKASKKKRRKPKKKAAAETKTADSEDEDDDDEDEDDDDEVDDNEEEEEESSEDEDEKYERNEARLEKMREEIEEAKQQQIQQEHMEEDLRAEHLATTTDVADGPSIRRKRNLDTMNEPASSLIANLTAAVTPPHDFSKKLELDEGGKTLFPVDHDEFSWTPPDGVFSPNDGAFMVELEDFDVARAQAGVGNNTVAIKFMAPQESKRFSINITGPDHNDFDSILFHFNPRQREKGGQLVVNDKQEGNWGQALQIPLSQVPLMFGQTSSTLIIQINGEGFDIFIENKHCARLEHRKELPHGKFNLVLQFPSTDDYGKPENWMVYKVWWGNRQIMAKGDLSGVAGVNTKSTLHPRKLFVSGLHKVYKEVDVDIRRAELERAFRKYGGARGAQVIVPKKSTYAFVEFETERQADLALSEMSNKYRLNRARRSKHEALQEERAAKEAAKGGGAKKAESSSW